jgi:hypothetical protein
MQEELLLKLAELNRPCLCWGPGMIPNPQLHIAAVGPAHRAISLLEWSPTNGKWLERIELSANDQYRAFDHDNESLPTGCVLPKGFEHLAEKPKRP